MSDPRRNAQRAFGPVRTVLIVPAETNQASQCRIVAANGDWHDALSGYRANPREWIEVGLMNSRGEIVCIEPEFAAICADAPLMAGVVYRFEQGEIA